MTHIAFTIMPQEEGGEPIAEMYGLDLYGVQKQIEALAAQADARVGILVIQCAIVPLPEEGQGNEPEPDDQE